MSKLDWSNEQQLAIDFSKEKNVLISAGAGSGKTAVLTERIYRLIKKGHDVSRFLVMTFTNAAAAEMKERVRKHILSDDSISEKASEVENSHIETFDAFSLFLVKKYANLLNISPDISVIDQSILNIQINRIRDEIFNEYYEKKDPVFLDMVMRFSLKNDNLLKSLVSDIYRLANLQINKDSYYKDFEANYLAENKIKNWIEDEYKTSMKKISNLIKLSGELQDLKVSTNMIQYLQDFECAQNYDELAVKLANAGSTPTGSKSDLKSYINDEIDSLKKSNYGSSDFIIKTFDEYKPYCRKLLEIARELDNRIFAFQNKYNTYSFAEIQKLALKVLSNEEARKEMSESFDYVMVDEYQDTSDIQEAVINALGKDNVYCVGDVKQSIYRFRNANCGIFNDKYNNYKAGKGGEEIDMNSSFRSREEIVSGINDIFLQLMKKETNIIDYSNGHNFGFGNHDYDTNKQDNVEYGFDICSYSVEEGERSLDKEMSIMSSDVISKINSGYLVFDKDKKVMRPCTFKDFAIIIDRSTHFDDIKEHFSSKNIPVKVIKDEELKDSHITYVTKNLLVLFNNILNNIDDDSLKHAYISIARSFLVKQNDREIYQLVKMTNLAESELGKRIQKVIGLYKNSSLFEILNGLYEEFDIYSKIPSIGNCSSNMHKCDVYLNFAKNMDSLGYSLEDMIQYFNDLSVYDLDISYSDSSTSDNAVTVITIHKSKGLEYPVVYFPLLGVKFNKSQSSSFIVDQKYGIVLPLTGNVSYNSILNHQIKEKESKEDFEEKLRLLYVALTRVREKGILLIKDTDLENFECDVTSSNNFAKIISSIDYQKYIKNYPTTEEKLNDKENKTEKIKIQLKSVNIEGEMISQKHASKAKSDDVDDSLLEFGTKVHYLFEIMDFKKKDTSFIKNANMRKYVDNVINSFVFENLENAKVLHEYKFYDKANEINGIIDCLIVRENSIDIVDFKLKKIDDEHYDEQLKIYENYIKQISAKPINKYLISCITGEVKKIG